MFRPERSPRCRGMLHRMHLRGALCPYPNVRRSLTPKEVQKLTLTQEWRRGNVAPPSLDLHGGRQNTTHHSTRAPDWIAVNDDPHRHRFTVTEVLAMTLVAGREKPVARPVPLHGEVAETLVDFGAWERRALRDGRIDPHEAMEGVGILRSLVNNVTPMVATMEHVATCIGGSRGMFSPRAERNWREAHRRYPDNVIAFPSGLDQAAGD